MLVLFIAFSSVKTIPMPAWVSLFDASFFSALILLSGVTTLSRLKDVGSCVFSLTCLTMHSSSGFHVGK